ASRGRGFQSPHPPTIGTNPDKYENKPHEEPRAGWRQLLQAAAMGHEQASWPHYRDGESASITRRNRCGAGNGRCTAAHGLGLPALIETESETMVRGLRSRTASRCPPSLRRSFSSLHRG